VVSSPEHRIFFFKCHVEEKLDICIHIKPLLIYIYNRDDIILEIERNERVLHKPVIAFNANAMLNGCKLFFNRIWPNFYFVWSLF
jgi:hypothetical protein